MSEPTLRLPRGADELLQRFPTEEPDYEAQAKEIQARLATGVANAGVTFDNLLAAPSLDPETGEPAAQSEVRAAVVPKSNFAEMARKSLQKKDDDSAELTKELLAATGQRRPPNAEMVERVRAAGRTAPGASAIGTPLPSSSREPTVEEAARPSGVVARAQATPPNAAPSTNQRGTIIGIVGMTIGIAACVALFLKTGSSESPTSAALAAEKAAQAAAIAPAPPPPTANLATTSNEGVTTPEALAAPPQAVAMHESSKSAPKSTTAAGKATAAPTKPGAVVLEDDATPAAPVAAAEPKPAPAAAEPPLKPAQGASGDVPLTPSGGAVSTALNSVRGGAQACLAGQTDAVTAVVTFASDGHVLRVSAGGPSGACIQAALSKARIAPFARDSFSAPTMIRPP